MIDDPRSMKPLISPRAFPVLFLKTCAFTALGVALFLGVGWGLLYLAFGPQLWKDVISKQEIPGHGTLLIGQSHDGDISYEFYVKMKRVDGVTTDWQRISWSTQPASNGFFAHSSDQRFWCCGSGHLVTTMQEWDSFELPLMAIFDTKTGLIWPSEKANRLGLSYWLGVWERIHKDNPSISLPELKL